MNIIKHHGNYNRSRRTAAIKYIVVHYTGTQASALNNCKYFAGGDRQASADYFIDDSGVYEYNDPASGYYTWAVGDGAGKYGITNNNSINIEVVSDGREFSATEIDYLAELVRKLMVDYNVPESRVVRHYDASRKQCPKPYIAQAKWDALRARLTQGSTASWIWDAAKQKWWYRYANGSYPVNQWLCVGGKWYLFDKDGWMLTGWQLKDGDWYYLQADGAMLANGWAWINGQCYCFDVSGAMRKGFIQDGGKWYYCREDGSMVYNMWAQVPEWDNNWFYFYNDGSLATSTWIGNYHVDHNGVWDLSR